MKTSKEYRLKVRRYQMKHPKRVRVNNYRCTARMFLRRYADLKDINEDVGIIKNRLLKMKEAK